MKYTVVVKEITSSNGDFKRQRFNNVNKRIIRFLIKYQFSFTVGIIDNIVNKKTAKNYIEIYKKYIGFLISYADCKRNEEMNELLICKLTKNSKERK